MLLGILDVGNAIRISGDTNAYTITDLDGLTFQVDGLPAIAGAGSNIPIYLVRSSAMQVARYGTGNATK